VKTIKLALASILISFIFAFISTQIDSILRLWFGVMSIAFGVVGFIYLVVSMSGEEKK
jgi:hypothetical protein